MSRRSSIVISVTEQRLNYYSDGISSDKIISRQYPIASAKNGVGQMMGSECTPLGQHRIYQKIGDKVATNSVFIARQLTGEIYSEDLAVNDPQRDWILTRILWLEGVEPGINQGILKNHSSVSCDTRRRFIYIHGCPDSHPMQIPSSHGCIKMRNADIIELYELVSVGNFVDIQQ